MCIFETEADNCSLFTPVDDSRVWNGLRAPFIDKLSAASAALESMRKANEAAIQAELTALAFEIMVNQRRLSVTDDESDSGHVVVRSQGT